MKQFIIDNNLVGVTLLFLIGITLIGMVLFFSLMFSDVSINNTPIAQPNQPVTLSASNQTNVIITNDSRIITYPYRVNGQNGFINFTMYNNVYEPLSKESHRYFFNSDKEVIMKLYENDEQDIYLEPFLSEIRTISNDPDYQAKVAISLVQHIPYEYNNTRTTDWYFPYETLYLNHGICSDKSILLSYLLEKLGYDVVLFRFVDENHMVVGIKSSPEFDYRDSGYAYIEATDTSIITDAPEMLINGETLSSYPQIVYIRGGNKMLNVSEEYEDATRLNYLESIGSKRNATLDQNDYSDWINISNKYDLFYESNNKV